MDELIFGIHAVKSALNYCHDGKGHDGNGDDTKELASEQITALYVDRGRKDNRISAIVELAKKKSVKVTLVQRKKLDELTSGNHQGVVAQSKAPKVKSESFLDDLLQTLDVPPFLLILDGVQDPHNLGACLRTADAAGVHAIIVPKDRSVSLTPTVRKVACGADQSVPLIQVTNLARTLKLLKSYQIWIVGTADETNDTIYSSDLTGPLALVMGTEGKGMRRLTRENCDALVKIPMLGQVESLNVSVATGIGLFEALRQRS
ncbi:23S rRNA (guanosine(2251)-2'-O)-methyltransferase RlmB [sulfur-oxidizing endosymbiont of Gigantopelta aegis]|uniref:23S rRNA (guanosine(2251)-2'-O)-methyltransferase RlmB n=1 Tax=sulfur-oxidizing endosymbiont of Gigantopelta aegis TaxID=2794934 RepID=UPI0018DBD61E|nr:23S rRNA (guanosine(2251)-2'-O)-methyltransferase RlmB [sulfur-oxidizing endosymbiont of Gigantopelta aegis]